MMFIRNRVSFQQQNDPQKIVSITIIGEDKLLPPSGAYNSNKLQLSECIYVQSESVLKNKLKLINISWPLQLS